MKTEEMIFLFAAPLDINRRSEIYKKENVDLI